MQAFDNLDGDVLELLSDDDLIAIAASLAPDTTTLVLVWEKRWATAVSGRVAAAQQAPSTRRPASEPPPAAAAPVGVDELHTQLTKLAELRQAGLPTEDEFAAQKGRLLAQ